MWPFTKKKQAPVLLTIEKITTDNASPYYPFLLHILCLVCEVRWMERADQDGYPRDGNTLRCPKCGASHDIKVVREAMRATREVELQIEQAKARIEKLKELRRLKAEEKFLSSDTKRIIDV